MSLFVQFLLGCLFTFLIGYKLGQHNKVKEDRVNKKELLNKLEEINREYNGYKWGMSQVGKSEKDYNYACGLCEATERIIKLVKED